MRCRSCRSGVLGRGCRPRRQRRWGSRAKPDRKDGCRPRPGTPGSGGCRDWAPCSTRAGSPGPEDVNRAQHRIASASQHPVPGQHDHLVRAHHAARASRGAVCRADNGKIKKKKRRMRDRWSKITSKLQRWSKITSKLSKLLHHVMLVDHVGVPAGRVGGLLRGEEPDRPAPGQVAPQFDLAILDVCERVIYKGDRREGTPVRHPW